ncbi:MAG: DUF547 domain-containing protein [Qipengyuania sp.]
MDSIQSKGGGTMLKTLGMASVALTAVMGTPLAAQNGATLADKAAAASSVEANFAQFAPRSQATSARLDYSIWDEALDFFVLRMGPSLRQGAPSVSPGMGTRRTYGHDSLYRLEGNRVIFSFLNDDVKASLTEYREDLERIGSEIDIAGLARNEQLAYWINLHNVAVIERIARDYPVEAPSRMKIGAAQQALDDAPFITVAGVAMSPKDIRTKIVYPHWSSPKVIYGFFRGDIGGPSIQRDAFSSDNVDALLTENATEFVNALRGTEKRGSTLHVSTIYEEARPFYFRNWPADLRGHLTEFASDEVRQDIAATSEVKASIYEPDIADLANGDREPSYGNVQVDNGSGDFVQQSFRIPQSIGRLMTERSEKMRRIIKDKVRTGRVEVLPFVMPGEEAPAAPEVE